MTDRTTTELRCPACNGRGYHRCACWPGDCICGSDDEDCEICGGTGWLYPDEYDDLNETARGSEGETTSGSSKWGPQFPPSSCTAYEDCVHDGVCHDPNCGAPSQHGEGEA